MRRLSCNCWFPRRKASGDEQPALVMQVTGEALELACQAQDQCMVQLIGYPATSGARPAKCLVSGPQPFDPLCANGCPCIERHGWHDEIVASKVTRSTSTCR